MNQVMHSRQAPRSVVPANTQRSEMELLMDTAVEYSKSDLVPKAYKNKPENILVAFGLADSVGIKRGAALSSIHVIEGTPSISAKAQAALVRAAGHKLRAIRSDSVAAQIQIIRADDPDFSFEATFTIEDARKAGSMEAWAQHWAKTSNGKNFLEKWTLPASLDVTATSDELRAAGCPEWVLTDQRVELKHKDNWHNRTEEMLWHRVVTRCVGRACPEVLAGIDLEYFDAGEPVGPPPVDPIEVLKPKAKPEQDDIEDAVIIEETMPPAAPAPEPAPVVAPEPVAKTEPKPEAATTDDVAEAKAALKASGITQSDAIRKAQEFAPDAGIGTVAKLAQHPEILTQVLAGF